MECVGTTSQRIMTDVLIWQMLIQMFVNGILVADAIGLMEIVILLQIRLALKLGWIDKDACTV